MTCTAHADGGLTSICGRTVRRAGAAIIEGCTGAGMQDGVTGVLGAGVSIKAIEVGNAASLCVNERALVVEAQSHLAGVFMNTILALFAIGGIRGVDALTLDAFVEGVGISIVTLQRNVTTLLVWIRRDHALPVDAGIIGAWVFVIAFEITQAHGVGCTTTGESRVRSVAAESGDTAIVVTGDAVLAIHVVFTASDVFIRRFIEAGLGREIAVVFCTVAAIIAVRVVHAAIRNGKDLAGVVR